MTWLRRILCWARGCDWNFGEVWTSAETHCKRCGRKWDDYMTEFRKSQEERKA